ncbi:hypothetical protein PHJA_000959300, partial [Phtheirospermum japonicum]
EDEGKVSQLKREERFSGSISRLHKLLLPTHFYHLLSHTPKFLSSTFPYFFLTLDLDPPFSLLPNTYICFFSPSNFMIRVSVLLIRRSLTG